MTQPELSMRLFVALDLPETWKTALAALQAEMQDAIAGRLGDGVRPRWVRAEGIHLTLKFLGETLPSRLEALTAALAHAVPPDLGFDLSLGRVGAFDQRGVPRVILATLDGQGDSLAGLYERIEAGLAAAGWSREKRAFQPHLTLARLPDGMDGTIKRHIVSLASAFAASQTPVWHVDRVCLMRSHLSPNGARYEHLAAFPGRLYRPDHAIYDLD